ncbi:MAG TPA: right-handed parallel beta-helix repeat-containing protein [Anaerolineales bacterium]|nr:right-handed parallel beta-helix repeat-containing protein [Anaerolineales bacterium]
MTRWIALLALLAMLPAGVGSAQGTEPPPPATPFEADFDPAVAGEGMVGALSIPPVAGAFQAGGARLVALQAWDGGWGWPLNPPTNPTASPLNTIGPIGMGLGKAFEHTGDANMKTALGEGLGSAAALLLSKSGNYSPSDGYLAAELDGIFGGTTYRDSVKAGFYDLLHAGTYYRAVADPNNPYDTAEYINRIRTGRSGSQANLAAWDVGMGLVAAAMAGADQADIDLWIAGTEAEINELDGTQYYDVIGLAGGLYGLAFVGEEFDPTGGQHAAAWDLDGLAQILISYQLSTGGFTWNSLYQVEGDNNETTQETAYAILALNQLNRATYLPSIIRASDWLYSAQAWSGTGGWWDWALGDENNEITGEALWALDAGYPVGDVWVCQTGNCGHPEAYYNTIQEGVDNVNLGGTVHVLSNTGPYGLGTPYAEQVTVTHSLQLYGEDMATTTIKAPGSLPAASNPNSVILMIKGIGTDVEVTGFTIAGPGPSGCGSILAGIFVRDGANANIHDNTISNIRDSSFSGCQNGVGIFVGRMSLSTFGTATITNNMISGHQKGGIVVDNTGSNAVITGNTITGVGTTAVIAQNGIQISRGATATLSGNTVTGHSYHLDGNPSDWGSAGLLFYNASGVTFSGPNSISGNDVNLYTEMTNPVSVGALTLGGSVAPPGIGMDIWNEGTGTVDATSAIFTGAVDGFDKEDRVFHKLDDCTKGLVTWTLNNVYVTLDSGSIQCGIDASATGGIVNVDAGTFNESLITIGKSLTVTGAGAGTSIIDGGGVAATGHDGLIKIDSVTTGPVVFEGFTVQNAGGDLAGTISLVLVDHNSLTSPVTVQDNHFVGRSNGDLWDMGLWSYSTDGALTIQNNEFDHMWQGLLFERSRGGASALTNDFHDLLPANDSGTLYEAEGIFAFTYSGDNVTNLMAFNGNTFTGYNGAGIAFGGGYPGHTTAKFSNVEIKDNTINAIGSGLERRHVGIYLINYGLDPTAAAGGGVANATISGNTITTGGTGSYGIWLSGPHTNVTIEDNQISDLDKGIATDEKYTGAGFTQGLAVHLNSITGNTLGVSNGSSALADEIDAENNWWGALLGPDAPDNTWGTGDPITVNVDYSPWCSNAACTEFLPPWPNTVSLSTTPEPTFRGNTVTINITVANDYGVGPVPVGTVDVGYPGLSPIPTCNDLALDGSGHASCTYAIPVAGGVNLTADFTPTDSTLFKTSSGSDIQKVWMTPVDFDGNRASDVVIFSSGTWKNYDFDTGALKGTVWTGNPGGSCIPAPIDYDGDGITDYSLFCGTAWHFYNDDGTYYKGVWLGSTGSGGTPVPADYNGDGRDEVVVFKAGAWHMWDFATGAYSVSGSVWTGYPGHTGIAVALDYNGDGKSDRSIFSGTGAWHFYNANGSYNRGIWVGRNPINVAVPGDYDADGTDEPVVHQGGAWQFYDFATGAYLPGSSVWTGVPPVSAASGPFGAAPIDFDANDALDFGYYAGSDWYFYNPDGSLHKNLTIGGSVSDVPLSRRQPY